MNTDYNKIASDYAHYALLNNVSMVETLVASQSSVLKEHRANPGKKIRIIDIGCAGGDIIYELRRILPKGLELSGIDYSNQLIRIAKKLNADIKNGIKCADFDNIPFDSCYFDCAFSIMTLHYSKDLLRTYREIYRVLRPGGELIIWDAHPLIGLFYSKTGIYLQSGEIVEFPTSVSADLKVSHPRFTLSDYFKAIRDSGFNLIDMEELEGKNSSSNEFNGFVIPTKLKIIVKKPE